MENRKFCKTYRGEIARLRKTNFFSEPDKNDWASDWVHDVGNLFSKGQRWIEERTDSKFSCRQRSDQTGLMSRALLSRSCLKQFTFLLVKPSSLSLHLCQYSNLFNLSPTKCFARLFIFCAAPLSKAKPQAFKYQLLYSAPCSPSSDLEF